MANVLKQQATRVLQQPITNTQLHTIKTPSKYRWSLCVTGKVYSCIPMGYIKAINIKFKVRIYDKLTKVHHTQ